MARPLWIQVAGALYQVTARGNEGRAIYRNDRDRARFVERLGEVVARQRLRLHAYVLMRNHYHLLVETPEGNLSRAMGQLKGRTRPPPLAPCPAREGRRKGALGSGPERRN